MARSQRGECSRPVPPEVAGSDDTELLGRFLHCGDETAFAALVERHGPLVLGVCRQVLGDTHEAEDAFQATFLILVRKARSIRAGASLAGWLHRVAYNVAVQAGAGRSRRRCQPLEPEHWVVESPEVGTCQRELCSALHEEVNRLPDIYRIPIILTYFEGCSTEAVARVLGSPVGTVKTRLSRARDLLRERLLQRGLDFLAVGTLLASTGRIGAAELPPGLSEATGSQAAKVWSSRPMSWLGRGRWLGAALVAVVGLLAFWGYSDKKPDLPSGGAPLPVAHLPSPPFLPYPPVEVRPAEGSPSPRAKSFRMGGNITLDRATVALGGQVAGWVGKECALYVLDPTTGTQTRLLLGNASEEPTCLALSPDGRFLAAARTDGLIRVWDILAAAELFRLPGPPCRILSLVFSPDGRMLTSCTQDAEVTVWDLNGPWLHPRPPR